MRTMALLLVTLPAVFSFSLLYPTGLRLLARLARRRQQSPTTTKRTSRSAAASFISSEAIISNATRSSVRLVRAITPRGSSNSNETHHCCCTSSSSTAQQHKTASFYKQHYVRVGAAKPGDIQYSFVVKANHDQSDEHLSSSSSSSSPDEEDGEFLLATVRFCYNDRNKESRGNSQEWIWLRSLCVHTAYRGQGWSRKLLEMALSALHQQHDPNTTVTPIYCFAKAALGSRLYVPLGFRPVTANLGRLSLVTPQPNNRDNGTAEKMTIPNSLRQRFSSIVRRMVATQGNDDDDAVDMECFGYSYCGNETAACRRSSNSKNCRPMPPLVNLLILQHERETVRKTGTAQLVLESSNNNDILGLNVTATTWAGRSDTERVERLLREQQQQQQQQPPTGENNSLVLLWTGGTADVSSFLAKPCNDEPINTTDNIFCNSDTTFILLDGTWQEARTMFRKIQLLWNLPRLSLRATQSSRYRLRHDYGWKKKFGHKKDNEKSDGDDGDVENSLLCTAEVMAELLQQTGNTEGAAIMRNRLETFMARMRPSKKEYEQL